MLENETTTEAPDPRRRTAHTIDLGDGLVGEWEDAVSGDEPADDAAPYGLEDLQFFETLFAGCEGAVYLCSIEPDGPLVGERFVRPPYDFDAALRWAHEQSEAGRNVYFCPVTQPPGATGHRTKASAFELPAVFADVDPDTGRNLMAAGASLLRTERITALVASGRGWHPYANLAAPIRITTENRDTLEDTVYAFGAALNVAAHGEVPRKVDRFDLASLLRVPGTMNWPNAKKRANGRVAGQTAVLVNRLGAALLLDVFDDWRARYPRPKAGASTKGEGATAPDREDAEPGALPAEWPSWLAEDAILRARFERTQPGPTQTDGTASGFLLSLFDHLEQNYGEQITDAEALAVGVAFYARAGETKDPRTIARTWEKAKAAAMVDPHDTTDLGNAKRFASEHGAKLRYVYPWSRWHVFDGRRWAPDTTGEVERLAQQTAEALVDEAFGRLAGEPPPAERLSLEASQARDKERMKRLKAAVATKSRYRLLAMIELAQPHCAAQPEEFDRDPFVVNCQNGTLDMRTGELRPRDPADMLTKIVPVAYDPHATCPRWLAFLNRIFAGNERLIGYVQRALGAAMVGKVQEQVFHIFRGKKTSVNENGANGKTTLLETVGAAVGDYGKHAAGSTFLTRRNPNDAIRGDLNRLKDARLVAASETRKGAVLDDATIKAMTGGDKVVNRAIYAKDEEYESPSHIFLLTNHLPRITAVDYGMWRRVRIVPFDVTIPPAEENRNLRDELRQELEGIFAWLVEGGVAVQKAAGRLEPVPEVEEAVAAYRRKMDHVGEFLADQCEQGETFMVGAAELYHVYSAWCAETATTALTRTQLNDRLTEHGFERKRFNRGVIWRGLSLKEAPVAEMILSEGDGAA